MERNRKVRNVTRSLFTMLLFTDWCCEIYSWSLYSFPDIESLSFLGALDCLLSTEMTSALGSLESFRKGLVNTRPKYDLRVGDFSSIPQPPVRGENWRVNYSPDAHGSLIILLPYNPKGMSLGIFQTADQVEVSGRWTPVTFPCNLIPYISSSVSLVISFEIYHCFCFSLMWAALAY